MSFAVWLTGLSGSGKSAIAQALARELHARRIDAAVLESDTLRKQITPHARYDDAERDFFYAALVELGAFIVKGERPVIFDATANRRRYRDAARARIAHFCEAYVDTPIGVCRARDPKGLYRTAGNLPGVQAAYEPPLAAEVVLDGEHAAPEQSAAEVVAHLEARGWLQ